MKNLILSYPMISQEIKIIIRIVEDISGVFQRKLKMEKKMKMVFFIKDKYPKLTQILY
jgi:hypothetical protein